MNSADGNDVSALRSRKMLVTLESEAIDGGSRAMLRRDHGSDVALAAAALRTSSSISAADHVLLARGR